MLGAGGGCFAPRRMSLVFVQTQRFVVSVSYDAALFNCFLPNFILRVLSAFSDLFVVCSKGLLCLCVSLSVSLSPVGC